MTAFLDLRYAPVGGDLTAQVNVVQASSLADYATMPLADLVAGVRGRHVLIATHGFNVNRAEGIRSLANWANLLQLPAASAFVGLLWPGDSLWAHGLDYPDEAKIADRAGALLASFLDVNFQDAASISFASHSLGARVVLATIEKLHLPVRRLNLMAGAIDDDCLNTEFAAAGANVGTISLLASNKDTVLSELFPLGNFFAGILCEGHPWWRGAVGRGGPVKPLLANFQGPFQIPDEWNFNHGNYLEVDTAPSPLPALPVEVPPQGTAAPQTNGWAEAFTAGFMSTRFR